MKVKDIIAKQEEYEQIQQARKELKLFGEKIDALYYESEALKRVDATIRLIENEIMGAIRTCRDKLRKQVDEMEV